MKEKNLICEHCGSKYTVDHFEDFYDWLNTQFPVNSEPIPTIEQIQLSKDAWNGALLSAIQLMDIIDADAIERRLFTK
jgi:hypothetical protein